MKSFFHKKISVNVQTMSLIINELAMHNYRDLITDFPAEVDPKDKHAMEIAVCFTTFHLCFSLLSKKYPQEKITQLVLYTLNEYLDTYKSSNVQDTIRDFWTYDFSLSAANTSSAEELYELFLKTAYSFSSIPLMYSQQHFHMLLNFSAWIKFLPDTLDSYRLK